MKTLIKIMKNNNNFDKLTELVRQYKKNNSNDKLEEIFIILKPFIEKKCRVIYYKIKKYKIDIEDIRQELYLKIIKIIKEYDPKRPFSNYLFSCLKHWHPILKKEDITQYESLYTINEETNEECEEKFESNSLEKNNSIFNVKDFINQCSLDIEKQICYLYINNPEISQQEIAKKLGTYQIRISRIINKLRKKLRKFLLNN